MSIVREEEALTIVQHNSINVKKISIFIINKNNKFLAVKLVLFTVLHFQMWLVVTWVHLQDHVHFLYDYNFDVVLGSRSKGRKGALATGRCACWGAVPKTSVRPGLGRCPSAYRLHVLLNYALTTEIGYYSCTVTTNTIFVTNRPTVGIYI